MTRSFLDRQSRIAISGPDATEFLQGLITTDIEGLPPETAAPGALLTPQGKIMFFFMISRAGDGFSVEIGDDQAEAFIKRLTMYRLRAKVEIGAAEGGGTAVCWDEEPPQAAIKDLRFEKAGISLYRQASPAGGDRSAYDALRVATCVAEPDFDFALSDAFPHDILMDRSGGVSFKKGCFVGQEVVSRMQHRGTARRRLVQVQAESTLPASGTEIVAGEKSIGTLGTVCGSAGLAIVRTDRAGSAMANSIGIKAGDVPLTLSLPVWTGLTFGSAEGED